jgi:lycopene beta-cyclase
VTDVLSYRLFERFYGLDAALIQRFYAGRPSGLDKLRLLAGRSLGSPREIAAAARA